MSTLEPTGEDALRQRTTALVERHQLLPATAALLESHARLLDWGAGNLMPPTAPALPRPNLRLTDEQLSLALRMMGETLSALELEPVRTARRLADVGTGAGFPGLVLAIALPQCEVVLIESDPAKSGFLRNAGLALELDNVEVVALPLQEWTDGIGTCDVVTSRRVWRTDTIIEQTAPFLAPGGAAVRFHGRRDPEKEALALAAAEAHGLRLETVLPATTDTRTGGVRSGKWNIYLYVKD